MRHYDVLYNQLHEFSYTVINYTYSYRSFLIDFSITELQVVNTSEDTHVNHPWLRLRRVLSRLSPLRGGPLRDPAQGRTFLSLYHWFHWKKGRSLRTHWPYWHLHFHRSTSLRRTNQRVRGKEVQEKKERNEERASERSRKTVTVVVDESQQSRVNERLNNTGETHANRDAKGTCRGSASGATSTTN